MKPLSGYSACWSRCLLKKFPTDLGDVHLRREKKKYLKLFFCLAFQCYYHSLSETTSSYSLSFPFIQKQKNKQTNKNSILALLQLFFRFWCLNSNGSPVKTISRVCRFSKEISVSVLITLSCKLNKCLTWNNNILQLKYEA